MGELSSSLDLEVSPSRQPSERARTIVDAPVSYAMVVDEGTDEIVLPISAGTVTPNFAELPRLGLGIGRRLAASQQTLYTSDYFDDRRFEHYFGRSVVRTEGISQYPRRTDDCGRKCRRRVIRR